MYPLKSATHCLKFSNFLLRPFKEETECGVFEQQTKHLAIILPICK
jgi:hypothetical protein